ncbi:MAG: helix-turn-helix domain-containing protein [archaeon]
MWTAKIKLKHDCLLGNKCSKFNVSLQSTALSVYKEKGQDYSTSIHCMNGKPENLDKFIANLKKDKKVIKIERQENNFFLFEKAIHKVNKFYKPEIFFARPVLIDNKGFETWELAAWKKKELTSFIEKVIEEINNCQLLMISKLKAKDIFFPKLIPDLTKKQEETMNLALKEGYYKTPKKTSLRKLAEKNKVSLATFQQHLRKAEEKLLEQSNQN